jgi:hypothetical protein
MIPVRCLGLQMDEWKDDRMSLTLERHANFVGIPGDFPEINDFYSPV